MYKTIFLGLIIGLLAVLAIPSVMTGVNGSIENSSSDSNEKIGRPLPVNPPYIGGAVEHINQAQAALQNGDTEGANNHLELAKQSLQSRQPDLGSDDSSGRSTHVPVPPS